MKDKLISLRKQREELDALILACEQSLINEHRIEIEENLASKPEPYGDVTIGDIKFSVPKYVKWDNNKLLQISERITADGGNPKDYIDFKLSVSETKFKNFPPVQQDVFNEARSVAAGKISVKVRG